MISYFKHIIETNLCPGFKNSCSIQQQPPDFFNCFPSGEEHTFSIWGQKWRQLHENGKDVSPKLESALQNYSKAVISLQNMEANENEKKRVYEYKLAKAEEEQAKVQVEKREAQEKLPAKEQQLKDAEIFLQKAVAMYGRAIRSGNNQDKEVANVYFVRANNNCCKVNVDIQRTKDRIKKAEVILQKSQKQLQTAVNHLDSFKSCTWKLMKEVNEAKLIVDSMLCLKDEAVKLPFGDLDDWMGLKLNMSFPNKQADNKEVKQRVHNAVKSTHRYTSYGRSRLTCDGGRKM